MARTRKSLIRIITKGENIRKHESRILIAKYENNAAHRNKV